MNSYAHATQNIHIYIYMDIIHHKSWISTILGYPSFPIEPHEYTFCHFHAPRDRSSLQAPTSNQSSWCMPGRKRHSIVHDLRHIQWWTAPAYMHQPMDSLCKEVTEITLSSSKSNCSSPKWVDLSCVSWGGCVTEPSLETKQDRVILRALISIARASNATSASHQVVHSCTKGLMSINFISTNSKYLRT